MVIEWWWVLVAVGGVLLMLGAYGSWTAGRLDRLHHRVATARASLETELARRSAVVAELAGSGLLDPASALLLLDAAHRARCASDDEREPRESALSRAIAVTIAVTTATAAGTAVTTTSTTTTSAETAWSAATTATAGKSGTPVAELGPWAGELATAMRRVQLARRFHNDIVVSARDLRRRRLVTWFRLAGHAPMPRTIELEDGG